MRYDPFRHGRSSIRLAGIDYASPGTYYVTVCTQDRACLFGDVINGEMVLNACGKIVREEWERSARVRPELRIDAYVVMPNHLHGIVQITRWGHGGDVVGVGAHGHAPLQGALHRPPRSLGSFVGRFKGAVTRRINALRDTGGSPVWQRNYYEHIVRDKEDLSRIRRYIEDNPRHWPEDEYHV